MSDKCEFCDEPALFVYNGTPICIECWELFGYDDAEERDKVSDEHN